MTTQVICRLCGEFAEHHKGTINEGGFKYMPFVTCKCGFRYYPNVDHIKGPFFSDWEFIQGKVNEANRIIDDMFEKVKT